MQKEKKYLTYEQCSWLLPPKSSRKFRMLSQQCRLYRDGRSFVLKLTSYRKARYEGNGKWTPLPDKEVYEPPIAVIHPHNVAVLDDTAGPSIGVITCHNLYAKFFGIQGFSKRDRRSSVTRWWYNGRQGYKARAHAVPFVNGLQIDIATGDAVTLVPQEKRRRVSMAAAKPLREQIAAWDKFATTYFRMLDGWSEDHIERVKAVQTGFPALDEEPSVDGLLQLLKTTGGHRIWRLTSQHSTYRAVEYAKSMWNGAFEKWKEHIYETHGAYEWVPVLAKAA